MIAEGALARRAHLSSGGVPAPGRTKWANGSSLCAGPEARGPKCFAGRDAPLPARGGARRVRAMNPTSQGSFRILRVAGIDVWLHWSWLLIAYFQIIQRQGAYSSLAWNVAEYVALFAIVLLHEFGHAFATRQVGGRADQIVLWPFGGVAYVAPPPRPGAELWSIAAGPLVNVVLVGVFYAVDLATHDSFAPRSDAHRLLHNLQFINLALLIFNMLPIYPLDGGQILRSLLWFPLGRIRSLYIASIVGFIGVGLLFAYALWRRSIWMGFIAAYVFMSCWQGLQQARAMGARERE